MDLRPRRDEFTQTGADGAQIDAEVQERVFSEMAYPLQGVTEVIIGAAMEVHRELGSGFLEKV